MRLHRLLPMTLSALAACTLLSACPDGKTPSPPPRVPQPKVQHEPVDAMKKGPSPHVLVQNLSRLSAASRAALQPVSPAFHVVVAELDGLGLALHQSMHRHGQLFMERLVVAGQGRVLAPLSFLQHGAV